MIDVFTKGWMDVWKPIKDFPNYEVSAWGEVRNIKRGTILAMQPDICGYNVLHLYKNNKRWYKRVHRLVAQAFILNPENKEQVNHIDGNHINNNVENLEWVTQDENLLHAKENKLLSKAARPVVQLTLDGEYIAEFESITKAGESVNLHSSSIRAAIIGFSQTSAGYKWRYKDAYSDAK